MGQHDTHDTQLRAEDVGVAPFLSDAGVDVSFLPPPPPAPVEQAPSAVPAYARILQVISVFQAISLIAVSMPMGHWFWLNAIMVGGCLALCGILSVSQRSKLLLVIFMGLEVAGVILFGFPLLLVHRVLVAGILFALVVMLMLATYVGARSWRWISELEAAAHMPDIELAAVPPAMMIASPYSNGAFLVPAQ